MPYSNSRTACNKESVCPLDQSSCVIVQGVKLASSASRGLRAADGTTLDVLWAVSEALPDVYRESGLVDLDNDSIRAIAPAGREVYSEESNLGSNLDATGRRISQLRKGVHTQTHWIR